MSLPLNLVIWFLLTHYIADFVFQSRWMGNNKSSQWLPMTAHIATYTFLLAFSASIVGIHWVMYASINGAAHLVTDLFTSRVSKYFWYVEKDEHAFWCTIGFDQFAHVAVLLSSIPLLVN